MRGKLLFATSVMALLPSVALSSARAAIPEGMCEVILEAHDVFGPGVAGYQLLLDADHSTYGEVFWGPRSSYFGDYSHFEYKLPEDAEPVRGTQLCLYDGTLTLQIPAGTYDYMIVRPDYESLDIIGDTYGAADDFVFKAGETYHFLIKQVTQEYGNTDIADLIVNSDLCITSLIVPQTALGLTASEPISVTIANQGKTEASGFSLSYTINDGEAATEAISETLAPGESLTYEFNQKADLSKPGVYTIKATVDYADDLKLDNNSKSATTRHLEAQNLPLEYVFVDHSETFAQDWIIVDNNNDGATWSYSPWIENANGSSGVAGCNGCTTAPFVGDDWLISNPLNMKAGVNHVAFDMRSVLASKAEKLEVCVGTSPIPADMKVIATYEVASELWVKKAANFTIDTDGVYFVALHAVSYQGYNQFIGQISVKEGEFVGKPEITVSRAIAPISNSNLPTDGKVGLLIENHGTAELKDFTLSCLVEGPNGMSKTVVQKFPEVLAIDESATYMIAEGFDFSAIGEYSLSYTLTADNVKVTSTKKVNCFEPITTPDFYTNFSSNQNTSVWTEITEGGWTYNEMFADYTANAHGIDYGIISRGLAVSTSVRAKISYVASGWGETNITILCGKAGADLSTYLPVYEAIANQTPVEEEFEVQIPENGNYSFVIADTGDEYSYLRINDFFVSPICKYDLKLESADGFLSRVMPMKMFGTPGTINAVVVNRGTKDMTGVVVTAYLNYAEVSVSEPAITIKAGETATIPVSVQLDGGEGDELSVELEVTANETDEYGTDNYYAFSPTTVSRESFQNEMLSLVEYGTGEYGGPLYVGNIYEFTQTGDLTEIIYGFSPSDDKVVTESLVGISVYTVEGDKVGRCLFHQECQRGNGGILDYLNIDDMRLPAGRYYIEVAQLGNYNYGLGYDINSLATCYQRIGDTLTKVNSYALVIRAGLQEKSVVYAKNAKAVKITAPSISNALFSADEVVSGVVRNSGYETATFDAQLYINGELKATKLLSDMLPYSYADVDFEGVDLSTPGLYTIEIRTNLDDDENAADNIASLVIESAVAQDPYSLDFEYCNNFDANGDRFNPAWTTVDRNGLATDGWWRYQYKNQYLPCGFMAFNPLATFPSMDDTPMEGVAPYEGYRFGLAFVFDKFDEGAEGYSQSDVWLVSPMLQLSNYATFSLYVKSTPYENMDRKAEPYRLLVSEEAEGYDNFVVLGDDTRYATPDEWELVEADLSEYANKQVRVAVQYIGVPIENVCLMVDNLKVTTVESGLESVVSQAALLSYNAATQRVVLTGKESADIYIYAVDGTSLKHVCGNSVDVQDLPSGIYIAKSNTATIKFVK